MNRNKIKTYNKAKKINPNQVFVPKVDILRDYYVSKKGKSAKMSPTERVIASVLKEYKIFYISEVSFRKFGYSYSPYRFDFYLPLYATIIEYDGQHHSTTSVKNNDCIKNKFCRLNNIKVYRFNKKHYPALRNHIERLLNKINIKN